MNLKGHRSLRRVLCFGLILMLLVSSMQNFSLKVMASQRNRAPKTIGIVFDNSGSMYMDRRSWWCQAAYALEVIAAMMDDQDTLRIYPMSPITIGERDDGTYDYSYYEPLIIHGPSEAGIIRKIFTPQAGGTPIESLEAAYEDMSYISGEKWLMVLTDGTEWHQGTSTISASNAKQKLSEHFSEYIQNMNVLYVGIGSRIEAPDCNNTGSNRYISAVATSSEQVLTKVLDVCSAIFGRDELAVSSGSFNFDVTMGKIIVFVQGENIENLSVNPQGAGALSTTRYYEPHYSETGCGNRGSDYNWTIDESLQGAIAIYSDLDEGTYQYSCSGTQSSVAVYYEPDVDVMVTLRSADGSEMGPGEEIVSGDYVLHYELVDAHGNPTNSSLLGDVYYEVRYEIEGEGETVTSHGPGDIPLTLEAGDVVNGDVTVRFLKDYEIFRTFDDLGWTGGIQVQGRKIGQLLAIPDQSTMDVNLSDLMTGDIMNVIMTYYGETLLGEEFEKTSLDLTTEGGNLKFQLTKASDHYILRGDAANDYSSCEPGEYILNLMGTYIEPDGRTVMTDPCRIVLNVIDNGRGIQITTKVQQGFYQLSKIGEGKPIIAELTLDGMPLTDEELEKVTFTAECDGVVLEAVRIPGSSSYEIYVREGSEVGVHKIRLTAETTDEVGRDISDTKEVKIEIQTYPAWLKTVIIVGSILILFTLIWLFMNQKVLPKKILAANTNFQIDGDPVPGNANYTYSGGGKKKGKLEVKSPRYNMNPVIKTGVTLTLEAVSPRRVPSSQRSVKVTAVAPYGTITETMQVGAQSYQRDEETRKFVRAGGRPFQPFEMNNNATIRNTAMAMNPEGGDTDVFFSCQLKYRK